MAHFTSSLNFKSTKTNVTTDILRGALPDDGIPYAVVRQCELEVLSKSFFFQAEIASLTLF